MNIPNLRKLAFVSSVANVFMRDSHLAFVMHYSLLLDLTILGVTREE